MNKSIYYKCFRCSKTHVLSNSFIELLSTVKFKKEKTRENRKTKQKIRLNKSSSKKKKQIKSFIASAGNKTTKRKHNSKENVHVSSLYNVCQCVCVVARATVCGYLTREYCTKTARRRNNDVTRARRSGLHTMYTINVTAAESASMINTVPKTKWNKKRKQNTVKKK